MQRSTLLAAFLLLGISVRAAGGQSLFAPGPGVYLTAVPLSHLVPLEFPPAWYLGGGVRLGRGADLGVRVGRGRDTPPGQPLPITYVGQTAAELSISQVLWNPGRASGLRLLLAPGVILEDRSEPEQHSGEEVTFRGGRRVSQVNGRVESHFFWKIGEEQRVRLYPMIGALVTYRSVRESTIGHVDGQTGTVERSRRASVGVLAGIPVSLPIRGMHRIAIEPVLRSPFMLSPYGVLNTQLELAVHVGL